MGGARQLLHKLSRITRQPSHVLRPSPASSSSSYEQYRNYRQCPHAFYFHSSDDDEQPEGKNSAQSAHISAGSPNSPPSLPESKRARYSAECGQAYTQDRGANTLCGIAGTPKEVGNISISCANRRTTSPENWINRPYGLASLSLSQVRAARTSSSVFQHGHPQGVSAVRFSSTATEQHLEGELGKTGVNADGFGAANTGITEVLTSGKAQAVSEVSTIVGDCSYPTAALQLLMESVHVYAGLPWWASIAVTTIAIRTLCLPVVVYQIKSAAKLSLMRPEMERINAEIKDSNFDPDVTVKAREEISALFKKHQTSPLSPFVGGLLQAPVFICFFFGIRNMVERLDSFKEGGFWLFQDLSTVDSTYILPIILTASFFMTVELNAAEGMEGNPFAEKLKNFMRIVTVVLFPISLSFEKAFFCYWITSNFFSLLQSTVLKQRAIKEYFGIPETAHLAAAAGKVPAVEDEGAEGPVVRPAASRTRLLGRKKGKTSRRR